MKRRIVSLLPSATEIVCALGARADLVGRSHECDYPPGVETLPVCTAPKVRVDGNSEEIHASVTALLEHAVSVYDVHSDLLRQLEPTHIVTQVQCEVCAVSLRDVQANVPGTNASVVALGAMTIEGIRDDFRRVGDAIGERAAADELIAAFDSRIDAIVCATRGVPRPRVATIEWLSPLMAAGNWVPELVHIAGGVNLFGEVGEHSPWLDWDVFLAADPEVIVVMPCGFSIERATADLHLLSSRPGWASLTAVQTGRVHVTDGNQFFNRPGPRIAESAEILAEVLHR